MICLMLNPAADTQAAWAVWWFMCTVCSTVGVIATVSTTTNLSLWFRFWFGCQFRSWFSGGSLDSCFQSSSCLWFRWNGWCGGANGCLVRGCGFIMFACWVSILAIDAWSRSCWPPGSWSQHTRCCCFFVTYGCWFRSHLVMWIQPGLRSITVGWNPKRGSGRFI